MLKLFSISYYVCLQNLFFGNSKKALSDAGQEATVRTRCGTMDWLKIVKGVHQGYI